MWPFEGLITLDSAQIHSLMRRRDFFLLFFFVAISTGLNDYINGESVESLLCANVLPCRSALGSILFGFC